MDIAVFELSLSDQGSFHRPKLCTFWDTPFGEHTSQKPVYIEHQGKAGPRPGQHRPVWDGMQGSVFRTHGGMCVITLFTPCNTKAERTWLSDRHTPAQRQPYLSLNIFGSAVGTLMPIVCLHFKILDRAASSKIRTKQLRDSTKYRILSFRKSSPIWIHISGNKDSHLLITAKIWMVFVSLY